MVAYCRLKHHLFNFNTSACLQVTENTWKQMCFSNNAVTMHKSEGNSYQSLFEVLGCEPQCDFLQPGGECWSLCPSPEWWDPASRGRRPFPHLIGTSIHLNPPSLNSILHWWYTFYLYVTEECISVWKPLLSLCEPGYYNKLKTLKPSEINNVIW